MTPTRRQRKVFEGFRICGARDRIPEPIPERFLALLDQLKRDDAAGRNEAVDNGAPPREGGAATGNPPDLEEG
jgi:hypothetical protein